MSKPATVYRIPWQAFHETENIQCRIDISDNDNLIEDSEEQTIIELVAGSEPARLSFIDNDEDPLTPVLAQQLTIQFISTLNVNMATFASGSDERWSVIYYKDDTSKPYFIGFLNMEGQYEAVLPNPNIIQLTANDGLGRLRDISLVDFDSNNPLKWNTIIKYLAWCLNQTGLSLELRVAFNIKLVGMNTHLSNPEVNEHMFSNVFLHALTFEGDENGVSENCRDVIEKILGEEARLFQMKGQWWILRVDEVEDPTRGLYVTSFDANGDFIQNLGEVDFLKQLGKIRSVKFSDRASRKSLTRPNKSVKLTYPFELPNEIPSNIDYSRGDLLTTVSPTQKHYVLDNWQKLWSNTSTDDPQDTGIYIRRMFDSNGFEEERYIVLEAHATRLTFIMSDEILVHAGDKYSISLVRRMSADTGGSGFYRDQPAQVRLYGDDGTFWTFNAKNSVNTTSEWRQCTSTFRTNQGYFYIEGDDSEDQREGKSLFDGEINETPVTGTLKILIYRSGVFGDTAATYIDNIRFDYKPKINGSHLKYSGQYHKTEQDGRYKAKRDKEVFMSDSPKKMFKGAMAVIDDYVNLFTGTITFGAVNGFAVPGDQRAVFLVGMTIQATGVLNNLMTRITAVIYHVIGNNTEIQTVDDTQAEIVSGTVDLVKFELAGNFYNAAVFPSGPPDETYHHPYGEIQLFDVWNQFKNEMTLVEGTMQGCDLDQEDSDNLPAIAHLINKWNLTDADPLFVNRYFLLLHCDQGHYKQNWRGFFREVVNLTTPKDYSNHEFKYTE